MKCDKIIEMPNAADIHGMRPQKFPKTGYVFANGEHRIPIPNDGMILDEPEKYHSIFTAIDGDTMTVAWQVIVDGNLDNCDADYQGLYAFSTCYNGEERRDPGRDDRQRAGLGGHLRHQGDRAGGGRRRLGQEISGVPVLDGQKGSPFTAYVPISNSPHGCNTAPDGKARGDQRQAVADGLGDRRDQGARRLRRQPSSRAAASSPSRSSASARCTPPSTARATPSPPCSWTARSPSGTWRRRSRQFNGEDVDPILDKVDVQYQPGHNHSSMGETKDADGKWLVSLNKFSKDRFINVGPLKPENEQLIDISGDKMAVVHDGPTFAEPHDCIIVHRSVGQPEQHLWTREDPTVGGSARQQAGRTASTSTGART